MKVTFVGHSSIFIETEEVGILCDPWYFGKVFNDSWALLSQSHQIPQEKITHLWISHEHPDHFHFPTLKSFPEEFKKRVTVLHQKHASPRLANAFKNLLGFGHLQELPINQFIKIGDLSLYCGSAGVMDSFLFAKSNKGSVLNLNDCIYNESQLRHLSMELGNVDYLFTQFSFANWIGNEKDQMDEALEKRASILLQEKIFSPRVLVPYASFVYFCNSENSRMNEWANLPNEISALSSKIKFMYPGKSISIQETISKRSSEAAIQKYSYDWEQKEIDPSPKSIEKEELLEAVTNRVKDFTAAKIYNHIRPLSIYLKDLDFSLIISFLEGEISQKEGKTEELDLIMCSQVALYMFKFPWGANTVEISGEYIDLNFEKLGAHPFFLYQTRLSTEFFKFKSLKQFLRVAEFFWRKKWEVFFRYFEKAFYPRLK